MFTAFTSLVGEPTTLGGALAQVPAAVAMHGPWGDGVAWPFFLLFPLFWILVIGLFIFVASIYFFQLYITQVYRITDVLHRDEQFSSSKQEKKSVALSTPAVPK